MLINNIQIAEALEQGGTVVVPSRQRAVAIRLAHTQAQIARGLKAWNSCDVLPYGAWLERCGASARHGALRGRRRLGAVEEWLEWRAAATLACEGTEVLMPAALGDALRRSAAVARDWSLDWQAAPGSEAGVLRRARSAFARRCQDLAAVSSDDWPVLLAQQPPASRPLLFAGFEDTGAALAARLRELGAAGLDAGMTNTPAEHFSHDADQVLDCADRVDELRRAAQWCREWLERDAGARLLVIVPQLAQWRTVATQCFAHALHGSGLLAAQPATPCFAIEGGAPLGEFALVRAGLALLAISGQALEFPELAALLRSPFIDCGPHDARCACELSLRDRNVQVADFATLRALLLRDRNPLVASLAPVWDSLAPALQFEAGRRQSAAAWARAFAGLLEAAGWPGVAALDSDEQQQRERFEALLGEFAQLGEAGGALTHAAAIELLRSLAARTAFEAASGDVAVTLTASCADPLVRYDGIWVAGLTADTWPEPSQPDPFIPIGLQRAAGLGVASATGQLTAAQCAMRAWRRAAGRLTLSWPRAEGDAHLQPSSLLDVALPGGEETTGNADSSSPADALTAALHVAAVLEARPAEHMAGWPAQRPLPGGTHALSLQSACPFRAAAQLRLGAEPLGEPVSGLDARERGQFLHRALELTWQELHDSAALQAIDAAGLGALLQRAVATAMGEVLRRRAVALAPPLVDNEQRRAAALLGALLEQERQRPAFSIAQLELAEQRTLGGALIRVRMDRVDRLADGRLVVLDYKSGRDQSFNGLDERPLQPQLQAYAVLAGGEPGASQLAGVAALYLAPQGIRWRGAAADPAQLPGLSTRAAPLPPWPDLLAHWRRVIDALVQGFLAGDARVAPRPKACDQCHLASLCRIDDAARPGFDAEEDEAGGPVPGSHEH